MATHLSVVSEHEGVRGEEEGEVVHLGGGHARQQTRCGGDHFLIIKLIKNH